MLKALGYYKGAVNGKLDSKTLKALTDFHNTENLEMRATKEKGTIDAETLKFMGTKYKARL